jgi:hypothetical protein
MSTLQFAWVVGFAGVLMFCAWLHYMTLPIGGLFSQKATPWIILGAALWPIALELFLTLAVLCMAAVSFLEKKAAQEAREKGPLKRGEIQPPYDGSLRRKRYWKKVRER